MYTKAHIVEVKGRQRHRGSPNAALLQGTATLEGLILH